MEDKNDFFISYNKSDRQWAKWVAATLEKEGYSTIIQAWDFRPGGNFVRYMQEALLSSERLIAILSEDYLKSLYCQDEWMSAFTRDPGGNKKIIIPVRITDIEPKGLLAAIIYIDLFGIDDEKEAEKRLIQGVDIESIPRNRPSFPGKKKARFPGTLPFNNLPHRNEFFTGRDELLVQLTEQFDISGLLSLTQSISGLGGIGKTQTALEYAYRYADKYDFIWWVNADSETTILDGYRSFCEESLLIKKGQQSEDKYIIDTVLYWFDNHDKWLFIYDNADEIRNIRRFLPKNWKGNILITSRNTKMHMGKSVSLDVLSEEEAIQFFLYRTGISDEAGSSSLAKRLGYLPLALEQAAAYIYENNITFHEYNELLEKYGMEIFDEGCMENYDKTINVTWNISINKIQSESAMQFLYICSYMAPDGIDVELFKSNLSYLPMPLKEDITHGLRWNRILTLLSNYSLINGDKQSFFIHRLLQEVIRNKLKDEAQYISYCLDLIANTFEYDYSNIDSQNYFIRLHPHALSVANYANMSLSSNSNQEKIAYIYMVSGKGYHYFASYEQAINSYQKALLIREKVLGREHPDTATTYNNIAGVYKSQGEYGKALEWFQKALQICEKVLGREHPDTATTYNNIALVYNSQGEYGKALEWYRKALLISEKVLGMEHPDTATTYNNIAVVYYNQGEYGKALEWFQKAFHIREKVLGMEHPDTAASYNNIAGVYKNHGEYGKALEWYQKDLLISEKVLGIEHPDTAATYNNIAGVYYNQGEYGKALEWYQKVLLISEEVLGMEHPDTATTYNNIALVYNSQGEYGKALEWYRKALLIREKVLGIEHPDTATTYNNIAGGYYSQGEYEKALEWYQKALLISEEVLGMEHPDTATTYNNIALVYNSQGEYGKALEWYRKALLIREKVLGMEHSSTATTYNNIAGVYDSQGEYEKALEWYQKALNILLNVFDPSHPHVKIVQENMAFTKSHM